jgi:F-box domain
MMPHSTTSSFSQLPVELIQRTSIYVGSRDISRLQRTCRKLRAALSEPCLYRERLQLHGIKSTPWEGSIANQTWISDGRFAVDWIVHELLDLWPSAGWPSRLSPSQDSFAEGDAVCLDTGQAGRLSTILWLVLAHQGRLSRSAFASDLARLIHIHVWFAYNSHRPLRRREIGLSRHQQITLAFCL